MDERLWKRTLYAVWLTQFTSMVGFSFVYPFLAYFIQTLGVTDLAEVALWSGLCTAATPVGLALFSPIWGIMADRRGRKLMLIRASAAGALTVIASAWVTDVWQLLALRLLQGITSGTIAASTTMVAASVPDRDRGSALGSLQTAIFLGATVGPLIGGVLAETIGFRETFVIAGIILAVSTLAVVFFVHEDFRPVRVARKTRHSVWRYAFRQLGPAGAAVVIVIVARFLNRAATNTVTPVLALLIQELLGGQARASVVMGIASAAGGIGGAIGAPLIGRWGDRAGHRNALILSTIVAAALYVPQYFVSNAPMLVLWQFLSGVAIGGTLATGMALLAQKTTRGHEGAIFGIDASASSMAGALGPLLGAAFVASAGIRFPFLLTTILLGLSVIFILATMRRDDAGGTRLDAADSDIDAGRNRRLGGINISRR